MTILDDILRAKREEVERAKVLTPLESLSASEFYQRRCISLKHAIMRTPAIIAEIKKASPSKGIIRQEFDPVTIARQYEAHGAAALSLLTDERYFQGSLSYLSAVRRESSLPILRKDFIIDAYQIREAKAAGADAVLLIAAALDAAQLNEFADEAHAVGLQTLVEIHTVDELTLCDFRRIDVLGINNRDLKTFVVDLNVTMTVREAVPSGIPCVSESGIATAADVVLLLEHGVHAFLIGEHFMRAKHPGEALSSLLDGVRAMLPLES